MVIVCKQDSGDRVADISDADLRAFNEDLWEQCGAQFEDGAADTHSGDAHVDVFEHL